MGQPTFVGIKNVSGAKIAHQYGGDITRFEKDEVKILTSEQAGHASNRVVWKNGAGGQPVPAYAFKVIPLEEALKQAKLPENQSIKEARDRQAEIDKRVAEERETWEKEFMQKLKDQGLLSKEPVGAGGKKS